MKYRKRPLEVEAWRFRHEDLGGSVPLWVTEYRLNGQAVMVVTEGPERHLTVPTLEGVMLARDGDWIVKGIAGELYPCKPDIFAATYEALP